jgi:hypothetical protein
MNWRHAILVQVGFTDQSQDTYTDCDVALDGRWVRVRHALAGEGPPVETLLARDFVLRITYAPGTEATEKTVGFVGGGQGSVGAVVSTDRVMVPPAAPAATSREE